MPSFRGSSASHGLRYAWKLKSPKKGGDWMDDNPKEKGSLWLPFFELVIVLLVLKELYKLIG
jgi:hypothetical protein